MFIVLGEQEPVSVGLYLPSLYRKRYAKCSLDPRVKKGRALSPRRHLSIEWLFIVLLQILVGWDEGRGFRPGGFQRWETAELSAIGEAIGRMQELLPLAGRILDILNAFNYL